jgi:hypothetical protein
MCKPVKVCLPDYNKLEDKVMAVIAEKYGLRYPLPKIVKEYDTRIVLDEAAALFKHTPVWIRDFANAGIRPLGIHIPRNRHWQEDLEEWQKVFKQDLCEYNMAMKCGWLT